ncbi:hypothetical protein DEU56DRAFT_917729 [Suillus clintonianus]|uniref:uncharacterized protein n=1 Tax=Suillus clintonianus TaxID=1904413 RepID=UPI001B881480|nr:uncharacterized protein DEU56DRAFT_917729 [Suillus clintonianus]KAG2122752.1 hypothetical protein DEU56DRAFT_917729 [Suillus clintonianus]
MEKFEAPDSEQLDFHHETETRSCDSLLPQDLQKCYEIICGTNKRLELELENVGLGGLREEYDKDLRGWKKEAQKLGNSKPGTRKMAFIGRTGAGKSTAMNAILVATVELQTNFDSQGACTSVQTEVCYEDLPPSTWRASIKFVEKDEWKKTLLNILDDLDVYGASNKGYGIHDDSRPAMDAWETLKQESHNYFFGTITWVYPHLRALSFPPPQQNIRVLLEDEFIATKLGTEIQRNGLRPYMSANTKVVEGKPLEWHLVHSVRIYGAFDVLASGAVMLVDVPGYGDANKTRTRRTEEYLKSAEVVILVADIKRAADDQAMRDYFVNFLHQMIRIDGSMESFMIVLTGTDVRIDEDQLHNLDSNQRSIIQQMHQEIDKLSDNLDRQEKQLGILRMEIDKTRSCDGAGIDIELLKREWCDGKMHKRTADQLQRATAAKNAYIAHQRSSHVREVFIQLYRQIYCNINEQNSACEPPPLPVFCIGSTDFNQLTGANIRNRAPLVFTTAEDTGIPHLRRHIHDFGRRNTLSDIKTHVHNCTLLWEEIESFFLSARSDLRLIAYENVARDLADGLKEAVDEIRKNSGGKMDETINELEKALQIQAEKVAKRSLNIVKTLGAGYRWHSYRALMRREGEWGSIDLNEDLVHGMLDGAVSSVWHNFFTDFVRSELQSLIVAVSSKTDSAILAIKNRAQRMTTIAPRINNACNLIHPRDIINPAREAYLSAILAMQREFCGTFKGLLRKELEDHYQCMASESGPGMYRRMKDLNEERFSPERAQELFAGLVNQVITAIRIARNKGETALDEALGRLYLSINRSLVCVQGNDQISKVKRRHMQKFLQEECSKPLAEVMTITELTAHGDKALDRLYSHIKRPLGCIQKGDKMTKVARKKMRMFLKEEYSKPLVEVKIIADRCKERNAAPIDSEVTANDF